MAAVPDLDLARIAAYCDKKVPARFKDEVRVEYEVRGKSVTIFECRPPWHPNLTEWSRMRIAQLRYDPDDHLWTLYCADRNGRWHRYYDYTKGTVEKVLDEITADPTGIFWG